MFKNNIEALKLKNPGLAERLMNTELPEMEAFNADSNAIIIAYNGIPLHSTADPIREAELVFTSKLENDSKNTNYIVYGMGLGYLFKRACISTEGRIIVFEPFIDILRFTLEYVDFSNELKASNVYICTTIEEVMAIIEKHYLIGDGIEFCYLPGYLKLNASELEKLTAKTIFFIKSRQQDQNTILNRSWEWTEKILNNFDNIFNALPVDILKDKFTDVPIVIASAGPSLEENLPIISKNRNKFLLIAVNTSLRALIKNDIIPDICISVESYDIKNQFAGLKGLDDIKFVLHPRSHESAWELGSSPNLMYLSATDSFSSWYNSMLDNKYSLWPSAGSVSILAFYLAFKILGASKVILVGQDLAFTDNQFYAASVMQEKQVLQIKDNKVFAQTGDPNRDMRINTAKIYEVQNSLKETVITSQDYFNYIEQYQNILHNEVPKELKVINTSLKGAYINGMDYIPFEEAIKELKTLKSSPLKLINDLTDKNIPEIKKNKETLTPKLTEFFNNQLDVMTKSMQMLRMIDIFDSKLADNSSANMLSMLINNIYELKKDITDFISKQEFILFALQKSNYLYLSRFIMPSASNPLSIEEHASNLYFEKLLLQDLIRLMKMIEANRTDLTASQIKC